MVVFPAALIMLLAASNRCADAQVYQYDYAPPMPAPSAASRQVNSFVCYMSFDDFGGYGMVSAQQVCNGVNECPEGEDEVGCGEGGTMYAAAAAGDQVQQPFDTAAAPAVVEEKGGRGIMPSGFVRLPDKLQQKEYYNGVQGAHQAGDSGLFGQSECSNFPAPLDSSCYIPWVRPNLRWYYDSATGSCLPFEYGGCGGGEPNQFATFDECMGSCFAGAAAGASCLEMGTCGAQEEFSVAGSSNVPPIQDAAAIWPLFCKDGSALNPEHRCDGFFDCSSGEDEANCGHFNSYDYYEGPTSNMQPPSMRQPDFLLPSTPDAVLELNSLNFEAAIAGHERILVNFYAPWCQTCIDFKREYAAAAAEGVVKTMGVRFARVNMEREKLLRERFQVETFPTLLYWDQGFLGGIPRQYYKSYGLSKSGLVQWLQKQISCTNGADEGMCTTSANRDRGEGSSTSQQENKGDDGECGFRCNDGRCQPSENRCNGIVDCPDAIDESNCGVCKRTEFTCTSDSACIDYLKRCDGNNDCKDGSDEQLCQESGCERTEFICSDLNCVSFALRCDGSTDCPDNSDEVNCPERCKAETQFTCNDGLCIDKQLQCDGSADCRDATDEISCGTEFVSGQCSNETEWECLDQSRCIDVRRRCDGYQDCRDLSDENDQMCRDIDCTDADWQFHCADKLRCIDRRRRCDGHADCKDGSDEKDCISVPCDYWQFKCVSSGICMDYRRTCDGFDDCSDGSDEMDCESSSEERRGNVSPPAEADGVCPEFCPAIYDPLCGTDDNTYSSKCHLLEHNCKTRSDLEEEGRGSEFVEIDVAARGECPTLPVHAKSQGGGANYTFECKNYEWQCEDGRCIELTGQCNGVIDCANGEDERFCDDDDDPSAEMDPPPDNATAVAAVPAAEGTFTCSDGTALGEDARCNGFPDCDDGGDEVECPQDGSTATGAANAYQEKLPDSLELATFALCDSLDEFTCKGDGSCLPVRARCDGMVDCNDESDEFDCPIATGADSPTMNDTNMDYRGSSGNWYGEEGVFYDEGDEGFLTDEEAATATHQHDVDDWDEIVTAPEGVMTYAEAPMDTPAVNAAVAAEMGDIASDINVTKKDWNNDKQSEDGNWDDW